MNLFQMKTKPHGIPRFRQFIDEKFVCIGWPEIGNLDNVSINEIRKRLEDAYGYTGHRLGNALGSVNAFCNTMNEGDAIFVAEYDTVYIGLLGKYEYEQKYDNDIDGMCHRRRVEWIEHMQTSSLEINLQKFVNNRNLFSKYPSSIDQSEFNKILSSNVLMNCDYNKHKNSLDNLFEKAIKILDEELKSEDPERRLKAATELLRSKRN